MNWYLAKVVYRIICGEGNHTAQFDEQLRLVTAANEGLAFAKATAIGMQEAEVFFNHQQQLVQWKFIGIAELYCVDKLMDGAEVYSQIKEAGDAEAYCRFILHKRDLLREKQNFPTFQTA